MIPVSTYARKNNITPRTVYRWIKEGRIKAEKHFDRWMVVTDETSNGMKKADGDISQGMTSDDPIVTYDTDKDILIAKLQEEVDYLRQELTQANQRYNEAHQRHDMIVAQLTQQNQLLLEDMRHRSLWQRFKASLGFAS